MTRHSVTTQSFSWGALLLILCAWAGSAGSAATQDPQAAFDRAARFYEAGQYDQAITEYHSFLDQGLESGPLYFNLGNCFLRKGDLGRAILNYERAKRLIPLDSDLDSNFRHAQSLSTITDQGHSQSGFFDRCLDWFSTDGLTMLLSTLYAAAILFLALTILLPGTKPRSKAMLPLLAILAILCLLGLNQKLTLYGAEAVILEKKAEARLQPFERAPASFTLGEGTRVQVVRFSRDWVKVRLSKEKAGWVRASDLELI